MATRAVAEFFCKVQQDVELARRLGAILADNKEAWASEVVRMAFAEGYDFEARDIDAAVEEQARVALELARDQLDHVSGGVFQLGAYTPAPAYYQSWPSIWYVPPNPIRS